MPPRRPQSANLRQMPQTRERLLGSVSSSHFSILWLPKSAAHPLAVHESTPGGATALVAVLPRAPVAVVPGRTADRVAAAAPRGPATTAPFGPAPPARTTPFAHSTACATGMAPASNGRIVTMAISVGFIGYLLVGCPRLRRYCSDGSAPWPRCQAS